MTAGSPAARPAPGRLRRALDQAPDAARAVTQFAVDNPAPVAISLAGAVVVPKLLLRAVRPRGPVEGIATLIVSSVLCAWGYGQLIDRGVLRFRIRGENNDLLPDEDLTTPESELHPE